MKNDKKKMIKISGLMIFGLISVLLLLLAIPSGKTLEEEISEMTSEIQDKTEDSMESEESLYLKYMTESEMEAAYGHDFEIMAFAKSIIGTKLPDITISRDGVDIPIHEQKGFSMVYLHATWCEACQGSLSTINEVMLTRDLGYPLYLVPVMQLHSEATRFYEDENLSIRPDLPKEDILSEFKVPFVPLFLYVEDGVIIKIHVGTIFEESL